MSVMVAPMASAQAMQQLLGRASAEPSYVQENVVRLWKRGADTQEIAAELGIDECRAHRIVAAYQDRKFLSRERR